MMRNKKGSGYILSCALVLMAALFLNMLMSFMSAIAVIRHQNEATKKVLDSYIVELTIDNYDIVKWGDTSSERLDATEFIGKLANFSALDISGNFLYSYHEDSTLRYSLSAPTLTASYIAEANRLILTASYTMCLPFYVGGSQVTEAVIPIEIISSYTPKF